MLGLGFSGNKIPYWDDYFLARVRLQIIRYRGTPYYKYHWDTIKLFLLQRYPLFGGCSKSMQSCKPHIPISGAQLHHQNYLGKQKKAQMRYLAF